MGIGDMLGDSFEYTKETFIGKWTRWVILIICSIIFPLIMGYALEMMRGKKPAPEPGNWVKTFIDGILVCIIDFIYMIPVWIIALIFIVPSGYMLFVNPYAALGTLAIGGILTFIVAIIMGLIASIAIVRYAREDKVGEAFNFSEILAKIKSIGWINLFIMILVMTIIISIIMFIINILMIVYIGWLLLILIMPAISVFVGRYLCLIYDSA